MSDDRHLEAVPGPPAADLEEELAPRVFDREAALEAIPLDVVIAEGVNLDADDPARTDSGRRYCIATRRAGGRCTAPAKLDGLLCGMHDGTLDSARAAQISAEVRRKRGISEEEHARLVRLGARQVIAEELHADPVEMRGVIRTLRSMAAAGDIAAAKALIPYLNQGLGMPTETVQVTAPESEADLRSMSTEELLALRASRLKLVDGEAETA